MRSLDEFASAKLAELERSSLRRALVDTTVTGIWLLRDGRRLLSFSCNDYLNLTHHPVKDAAIEALRVYGLGAGASRLVTGNHPLFAGSKAGSRASRTRRPPASSARAISPIRHHPGAGRPGRPRADRRARACLPVGGRAARARGVVSFRHADVGHVGELLMEQRRRRA